MQCLPNEKYWFLFWYDECALKFKYIVIPFELSCSERSVKLLWFPISENAIKQTKDNVIKIVNSAASQIEPTQPAGVLSEVVLRTIIGLEANPIDITINILKQEAGDFI